MTPCCSDCGTSLGERCRDRTGDLLCYRCNLRRYPEDILAEAEITPPAGVAQVAQPIGDGPVGHPGDSRYDGRILDVSAMLAAPDEPIPWRCDNIAGRRLPDGPRGPRRRGQVLARFRRSRAVSPVATRRPASRARGAARWSLTPRTARS